MVNISIFKLRVPTNVIVWAGSIDKTFPKTAFHMSPGNILAIRKAKNIHFKKKISEVLLIHLPMCSVAKWRNPTLISQICWYRQPIAVNMN